TGIAYIDSPFQSAKAAIQKRRRILSDERRSTRAQLQGLHLQDAGHRFDRSRNLRRNLESARQLDLDFGATLEKKHNAHFSIAIGMCRTRHGLETLPNRFQGWALAQENPQAFLQVGSSTIERIDGLYARTHFITLHFRRKEEQHRVARLETIAVFGQPFRENDCFKMAARVGKTGDAHLAACARAAPDARYT